MKKSKSYLKTENRIYKYSVSSETGKIPIAEGQRIHYNFVKLHMALEEKTPAEAAGVKVEGENKWQTLIQNAISQESQ